MNTAIKRQFKSVCMLLSSWATWKNVGVPYQITDRFFIEAALTIEAGTMLRMAHDVQIIVEEVGSLSSNGVAADPVVFTGVNPVNGYWAGIQFQSNSAENALSNTTLEYGGSDPWTGDAESDATLYVSSGARLALADVVISESGGYGVFLEADSVLACSNASFAATNVDGAIWDDDNAQIVAGCN